MRIRLWLKIRKNPIFKCFTQFFQVVSSFLKLFRVNKWYLPCNKWSRRRTIGILNSRIWFFKDWRIVIHVLDIYDHFGFDMLTSAICGDQSCIVCWLRFPFEIFKIDKKLIRNRSKLVKNKLKVVKSGQKWSKLVKSGKSLSKLVKKWRKIVISSTKI